MAVMNTNSSSWVEAPRSNCPSPANSAARPSSPTVVVVTDAASTSTVSTNARAADSDQ